MAAASGCLQIQPNKFPVDFLHWSSLLSITIIRTMKWQAALYQCIYKYEFWNVFVWACDDELRPTLITVPSIQKNYTADYKFFQEHQQKSRRFPVFPGGISNSRRFPVFPIFPGVVDTLYQGRVSTGQMTQPTVSKMSQWGNDSTWCQQYGTFLIVQHTSASQKSVQTIWKPHMTANQLIA